MREPKVTRTIETTTATVLCVNPETKEVFEKGLTLARTYKDEKALKKAIEKATINADFKVVSVISTKVNKTLYGMAEDKFIANAEILPDRN